MTKITLNGKHKEFSSQPNLNDLIGQCCQDTRHVIAELNGQIIKNPAWKNTQIKDGDTVELISMVGGG